MKKRFLIIALVLVSLASIAPAFAQWSSDPMMNLGIAVKPGDQVQPKIRPTPDGGCYISWFDNDPNGHPPFGYDVYLQRLDASGVAQWAPGGIRFADLGMSSTQDYGLDVDAHGNAVLAFLDDRLRPHTFVTVQRVTPAGKQVLGVAGRRLSYGDDFVGNPKVTALADGSIVAGWIEGNNLMFQKIQGGPKRWGDRLGITITAPAGMTYSLADLHASEDGTVIASWVAAAGFTSPKHLFANKISPDGALLWGDNHVAVFDSGSLQFGNFPSFVSDGAGGAVLAGMKPGRFSRAPSTSSPMAARPSRTTVPLARLTLALITSTRP